MKFDSIRARIKTEKVNRVIVSTHVQQGSVTTGSGNSETTETVYIPVFEYSYHLGGWDYTSDNMTIGTSWEPDSFDAQAEAEVYLKDQYPVGEKGLVYCDPNNPREVFLFNKEPLFTGGISIIMYAIIIFVLGIIAYVS